MVYVADSSRDKDQTPHKAAFSLRRDRCDRLLMEVLEEMILDKRSDAGAWLGEARIPPFRGQWGPSWMEFICAEQSRPDTSGAPQCLGAGNTPGPFRVPEGIRTSSDNGRRIS